jgi:hypothetical protein
MTDSLHVRTLTSMPVPSLCKTVGTAYVGSIEEAGVGREFQQGAWAPVPDLTTFRAITDPLGLISSTDLMAVFL